ncbi:MAG: NADH-quinone oxidoreductase subunit C [Leptospirales bacterium]|nr:NADH-quinone oxidoreductase subunit C [Leptospirales bacterium]
MDKQDLIQIDNNSLLEKVYNFFQNGYRLVQIHCTLVDNGFELNYSFDKDNVFTNLRITIDKAQEILSISNIYWSAFLYENEIADLFGAKIKNIVIDFNGTFYQKTKKAPFAEPKPAPDKKE